MFSQSTLSNVYEWFIQPGTATLWKFQMCIITISLLQHPQNEMIIFEFKIANISKRWGPVEILDLARLWLKVSGIADLDLQVLSRWDQHTDKKAQSTFQKADLIWMMFGTTRSMFYYAKLYLCSRLPDFDKSFSWILSVSGCFTYYDKLEFSFCKKIKWKWNCIISSSLLVLEILNQLQNFLKSNCGEFSPITLLAWIWDKKFLFCSDGNLSNN